MLKYQEAETDKDEAKIGWICFYGDVDGRDDGLMMTTMMGWWWDDDKGGDDDDDEKGGDDDGGHDGDDKGGGGDDKAWERNAVEGWRQRWRLTGKRAKPRNFRW